VTPCFCPVALVSGGGRGAEYPVTGLTLANGMLRVASCVANAGRLDSENCYKFNSRV
jgi:hypothetical protein